MSNNSSSKHNSSSNKKRWKKLNNKSYFVSNIQHQSFTGLVIPKDGIEYEQYYVTEQQQQQSIAAGVSIHSNKNNNEKVQMTQGDDHRHLIQSLLFYSNHQQHEKSKKYKPPSWVRIHNPALFDGIAIIEFALPHSSTSNNNNNYYYDCIPKKIINSSNSQTDHTILPFTVDLFQGSRPRHVTDVLLYDAPPKDITITTKTSPEQPSCFHLYTKLQSLCLTPCQYKSNGYPCCPNSKDDIQQPQISTTLTEKIQSILSSSTDNLMTLQNNNQNNPPPLLSIKSLLQEHNEEFRLSCVSIKTPIEDGGKRNDTTDETNGYLQTYLSTLEGEEEKKIEEAQTNNNNNKKHTISGRIFAMDCEMVRTSAGVELARVTLIQYHDPSNDEKKDGMFPYRVIMDELVKPHLPIIDYVTTYSGITPSMLNNVTTRLKHVQIILLCTLKKEDILIGHSLENDLRVLKYIHTPTHIVDTSIVFTHPNQMLENKKYSLAHLSAVLLKKSIQQQKSHQGHCSIEDAAASLYLALQRAIIGSSFHIPNKRNNRKNLFQKLTEIQKTLHDDHTHQKRPLVGIGPNEWIQEHLHSQYTSTAHVLTCEDIFASNVKAIYSFLNYTKPKHRRPLFLYSKLYIPENNSNKKRKHNDTTTTDDNHTITKRIEEIMVRFHSRYTHTHTQNIYHFLTREVSYYVDMLIKAPKSLTDFEYFSVVYVCMFVLILIISL